MVAVASKHDNALVQENYYELDINYQKRFEAKARADANPNKISLLMSNSNDELTVQFNEIDDSPTGQIILYRPSDIKKDRTWDLQLNDENKMSIPTKDLMGGRWKAIISWSENSLDYYKEIDVTL